MRGTDSTFMRRPAFIVLLCLLLLSLQHQGYVHPLTHLAFDGSRNTAVTNPQADVPCVECALLAGGVDAAHASTALLTSAPPPSSVIFYSYRSRAGEVPAWFHSRAPPTLL